ncbi:hypothetical protein MTR67_038777 [Solanum verrucosum]|uniref:Tf2-1-like SH3-like domain-containing protein n=1 Tax=Solanum verrucosum TaxID=315347 RepID=A0AAF0ZN20_SOLVR|nr:hypothetical protein MTR67_038777 [Solanum verrucosum]
MELFEALYGMRCHSLVGWFDVSGTTLLKDSMDIVYVIQERLYTSQSRKKSYIDHRLQPLEFIIGHRIFMQVSPMKRVMRFRKRGKICSRFIDPFDILRRIREVTYEIALPPALSSGHPMFHVSMLRRYVLDESHVIQ